VSSGQISVSSAWYEFREIDGLNWLVVAYYSVIRRTWKLSVIGTKSKYRKSTLTATSRTKYASPTGCEFILSVLPQREFWPLRYTYNISHNATGVAEWVSSCHVYTLNSKVKIKCLLCKEWTEAEETVEHGTHNTAA